MADFSSMTSLRAVDRILAPRPVRSTLALTEAKTDGARNPRYPVYPGCNVNVYNF